MANSSSITLLTERPRPMLIPNCAVARMTSETPDSRIPGAGTVPFTLWRSSIVMIESMTVIARLRRWRGACSRVRCLMASSICSAALAIGPFAAELSERPSSNVHLRLNGFAVKTLSASGRPWEVESAKGAGANPIELHLPRLDVDGPRSAVTNVVMAAAGSPLFGRAHRCGSRVRVVDDPVEGLRPQPGRARDADPRVGPHPARRPHAKPAAQMPPIEGLSRLLESVPCLRRIEEITIVAVPAPKVLLPQ